MLIKYTCTFKRQKHVSVQFKFATQIALLHQHASLEKKTSIKNALLLMAGRAPLAKTRRNRKANARKNMQTCAQIKEYLETSYKRYKHVPF